MFCGLLCKQYDLCITSHRAKDAKISAMRAAAAGQHLERIDVIWLRRNFLLKVMWTLRSLLGFMEQPSSKRVSQNHKALIVVSGVFMLAPIAIFV